MDLSQTANTNGLAHVDVAGDGSGADVEPVDVLRRKLLGVCHNVRRQKNLFEGGKPGEYVRPVLTVSTQPVDKGQQAEVIPQLRDSGFILHPLD